VSTRATRSPPAPGCPVQWRGLGERNKDETTDRVELLPVEDHPSPEATPEETMPHHIHRLTPPRARLLTAVALLSVALTVAGCGSSSGPGVAQLSSGKGASSEDASSQGASAASSESEEKAGVGQTMIAYAKCVRASGVPNFPDPQPHGGFRVGAGMNPSSPAFKAAQAKCQKLMPGGGGPPSSGSPPSAQTMAHLLKVSQCMRKHGVSAFPDPTTSGPSRSGGGPNGVAIDHEGAIFALSATIMQSPAFKQAEATCNLR
jgi:hypothetical protein